MGEEKQMNLVGSILCLLPFALVIAAFLFSDAKGLADLFR